MNKLFNPASATTAPCGRAGASLRRIASRLVLLLGYVLAFVSLHGNANASGSITIPATINGEPYFVFHGGVLSTREFFTLGEAGTAACDWSGKANGYPLFSRAVFVSNAGLVDTYTCWCKNSEDERPITSIYRVKKYHCLSVTDPHKYDGYGIQSGMDCILTNAALAAPHSTLTGTETTGTCVDPYVPDSNAKKCILPACPDHASRMSPDMPCMCDSDYEFDAAGTSCVRKCPIDPLPEPPFEGDTDPACTKSLEKGRGKDVDNVCPQLNPKMTEPNGGQIQCLADKINRLALTPAYTGPSATIRTEAYQQHLLDVWKWKNLISQKQPKMSNAEKQACAPVFADVEAHMNWHKIKAKPSAKGKDAPHVSGQAIDVPSAVVDAMIAKIAESTFFLNLQTFPIANCVVCNPIPMDFNDVQEYVNSSKFNPPACNLQWGGRFDPYDPVHFQLP